MEGEEAGTGAGAAEATEAAAVEAELDKALSRFRGCGAQAERVLEECESAVRDLQRELQGVPDDYKLTQSQIEIIRDTVYRCRETAQRLAGEHRDTHASVSRIGKTIDRHFISDYAVVAPRAVQFTSEGNKRLADKAVAQHLYRQGLDAAGDALAMEADLSDEVQRGEPFAALQRIATALASGDTSLALEWVEKHADELKNSPLPFTLHQLRFLQIAKTQGAGAAVQYARQHFPAHAARHERELQRAMCALAWYCEGVECSVPEYYASLRDPDSLSAAASDLFIREACNLLRLAPLSPLAAAVLAGGRVLPPLLDIRAKMSHPHVAAAWAAKDELPLEVDLGTEGGQHHSVFACPILRQQSSEQNPPMRLLCGHVISRDALTKLVQGVKNRRDVWHIHGRHVTLQGKTSRLKCPYCPTEQSQSEARLIYFS